MTNLLGDFRFAARTLAKSPGFTAAAVGALALGIGATVAIFSLVEASLLRGLPYRDPQRLVHLWEMNAREGTSSRHELSYPDYVSVEEGVKAFESVAGYSGSSITLSLPDHAERFTAVRVTANFFSSLGIRPALGRPFETIDAQAGGRRVVIVSHELWSRLFGVDADLQERTIRLQDVPHTIVGVLPRGFHFAPAGAADVWLPLRPTQEQVTRGYWHWLRAIARLGPGVTLERAAADADRVAARIEAADPRNHLGARFLVRPLAEESVGAVRPILVALAASVSCVLLIACANVALLLVGRSVQRRREICVRIALGATRIRLARSLMIESLLLAGLGAALGLLAAHWALRLVVAGIPADRRAAMPFLADVRLGGPVLIFAVAMAVLTALIFGLGPALHAAGASPITGLKGSSSGSLSGRRREPAAWLVAAEIALTLVLLTSGGLLFRSTVSLLGKDLGYHRDGLLTLAVWLAPSHLRDKSSVPEFEGRLLAELATIPGVESAATVSKLPIGGGDTGTPWSDGRALMAEANIRTISAGYFGTMGLPLRAGRIFASDDTLEKPAVVLINDAFARRAFSNGGSLGRRVSFEFLPGKQLEIVGVVANENVVGPDAETTPIVYFPSSQDPSSSFDLLIRTNVEPESLAGAVRTRLSALDSDLVAGPAASLSRRISDSPTVFLRRYPARLIGGFGVVGLALAAIGVFGVAAREVTRRTREIGVRMALGARPGDVARLVLAWGLLPIAVGLAAGAAGSLAAARLLSSLLFGVSPEDVSTLAVMTCAIAVAAAAASIVPALNASRVDPMAALRAE